MQSKTDFLELQYKQTIVLLIESLSLHQFEDSQSKLNKIALLVAQTNALINASNMPSYPKDENITIQL